MYDLRFLSLCYETLVRKEQFKAALASFAEDSVRVIKDRSVEMVNCWALSTLTTSHSIADRRNQGWRNNPFKLTTSGAGIQSSLSYTCHIIGESTGDNLEIRIPIDEVITDR